MGTDLVAVAFMSHGIWVAQCPRPGCFNAERFGHCDDGTLGGLEGDRFTCRTEGFVDGRRRRYGGCGMRCGVEWPANIADIERVLLARPVPASRNWAPGEDLIDLIGENIEHAIVPALEPGARLDVIDGQVLRGALDFMDRPAIEGAH